MSYLSVAVKQDKITRKLTLVICEYDWTNYKRPPVELVIPFNKIPTELREPLLKLLNKDSSIETRHYGHVVDDFLIKLWPFGNDYSELIKNRKEYDGFINKAKRGVLDWVCRVVNKYRG